MCSAKVRKGCSIRVGGKCRGVFDSHPYPILLAEETKFHVHENRKFILRSRFHLEPRERCSYLLLFFTNARWISGVPYTQMKQNPNLHPFKLGVATENA